MSLLVWLPLNGSMENKGLAEITYTGTPTYKTIGKIGNASLNLASRVSCSCSKLNELTEFSICCWAKVNSDASLSSDWVDIISFTDATSNGTTGYLRWETCYSSTNVIRGPSWHDNATYAITPATTLSGSQGIGAKDRWEHLTITVGKDFRVYRNGTLECVCATSGGHLTSQFWMGQNNAINGELNDVRIYDHCLSPLEVKEISQGLVLHYKLDGLMGGARDNYIINGNGIKGTSNWGNWGTAANRSIEIIGGKRWFHFTATAGSSTYGGFYQDQNTNPNQMAIKPNTNYTVSALMYASDTTQVRFWFHMRSTEGGANISQPSKVFSITTIPTIYTFTFNSGSNSSYTINRFNLMIGAVYEPSTNHEVYFTNVKFEEGTNTTAWVPNSTELGIDSTRVIDSSGYGNYGVIENTIAFNSDTPRYNISTNFVNDTSGIQVPTIPLNIFNNGNTIVFWIKPNGENGQRSVYCSSYTGSSYSIEKTAANKLRVWWAGSPDKIASSLTITDNEWQHIALVKLEDKAGIKLYKNGEFIETLSDNFVDKSWSGTYRLGRDSRTDATSYIGQMSDFRIYCTPLLDNDIKLLYNSGMRVGNLGDIHNFELVENNNNLMSYAKLNPNNATVTFDKVTNTYTITANQVDSSWGMGFVIDSSEANRLWVPWNATYRLTMEVWTPTARNFVLDYNNYPEDYTTAGLTGNDHDGTRLPNSIAIPTNTWTRITFGSINNNTTATTGNPNKKAIYDFSNFGFNTRDGALTYKIRNIQWYLVDETNKLEKTGILKGNHFNETILATKASIRSKEKSIEATNFIEI